MTCDQCGAEVHPRRGEMVILANSTWHRIAEPKDLLCIPCIESRLGRKITAEDFPNIPVPIYGNRLQANQYTNLREIFCNQVFFQVRGITFPERFLEDKING